MGRVAAHDLLALAPGAELRDSDGGLLVLPAWARAALRRWPWVVVRRARHSPSLIGVGVRGPARSLRCAAWLAPEDVLTVLAPAELAGGARVAPAGEHDRVLAPAWRALALCGEALARPGLVWGPTGSVGFALATGAPAVRSGSDLDLLVDVSVAAAELGEQLKTALDRVVAASGCRIDCQLRTRAGLVALAELVRAAPGAPVMLRHEDGTIGATHDPWAKALA